MADMQREWHARLPCKESILMSWYLRVSQTILNLSSVNLCSPSYFMCILFSANVFTWPCPSCLFEVATVQCYLSCR